MVNSFGTVLLQDACSWRRRSIIIHFLRSKSSRWVSGIGQPKPFLFKSFGLVVRHWAGEKNNTQVN